MYGSRVRAGETDRQADRSAFDDVGERRASSRRLKPVQEAQYRPTSNSVRGAVVVVRQPLGQAELDRLRVRVARHGGKLLIAVLAG